MGSVQCVLSAVPARETRGGFNERALPIERSALSVPGFSRRPGGRREAWPLWHPEGYVTRKRGAGCYHLDFSGGRAGCNGGRNLRARDHFEDSCGAVKADVSRAGQIGPQNLDVRSHFAGGRLCFHKRSQAYRQAKDRAIICQPALRRCPVEVPIGGLNQPGPEPGEFAIRATALAAEAV